MSDVESVPDQSFEGEFHLESLLSSWKAKHMLSKLKDENITLDVLQILNAEQLQELTRSWKIGDRVMFTHHFQNWRTEMNTPILKTTTDKLNCHLPTLSSPESENFNIDLMEILKTNQTGCRLLETYKKNNMLNEEQRATLINIIAQFFDNNNRHLSLQLSHNIESQILEVFRSEKLVYYRTENRGKIYTKYCNLKKSTKMLFQNKENKQIDTEKRKSGGNKISPSTSKKPKIKIVPEDDGQLLAQSLKFDNLSKEEFQTAWNSCRKYRLNQIFNECQNITEILKLWPQYRQPDGYKLIDKDFTEHFKVNSSIASWSEGKILNLFVHIKKTKLLKGDDSKVLKEINATDAKIDSDMFALKILWSLHFFLYPTGRTVKKNLLGQNEVFRFTTKDSQESFIFISPTMQGLLDHIDFLTKKKENIQPFILGVGDFDEVYEFFVYFNGTLFKFTNFLRAFDICFKIFHVFHLEYPQACAPFWSFVEQYFYNINTNSKTHSKVCIFLDSLNN